MRHWSSPFLRIAYVEHYLVPVDEDGEIPTWWERGFATPSADLVFHARAVQDGGREKLTLAQSLKAQGWSVDREVIAFADRSD